MGADFKICAQACLMNFEAGGNSELWLSHNANFFSYFKCIYFIRYENLSQFTIFLFNVLLFNSKAEISFYTHELKIFSSIFFPTQNNLCYTNSYYTSTLYINNSLICVYFCFFQLNFRRNILNIQPLNDQTNQGFVNNCIY